MKTVKIDGLIKNNRISTQDLLLEIQEKINEGYTDFEINACGQHDIGGSSWAKDKNQSNSKSLVFFRHKQDLQKQYIPLVPVV